MNIRNVGPVARQRGLGPGATRARARAIVKQMKLGPPPPPAPPSRQVLRAQMRKLLKSTSKGK